MKRFEYKISLINEEDAYEAPYTSPAERILEEAGKSGWITKVEQEYILYI